MDPRVVIEMLRIHILDAFDRSQWEWARLEVSRNPFRMSHTYNGSLRRIGEGESHHFMFDVDDHTFQGIDWYSMLRDRAIWSLRTAMEHQEFVRNVLQETVIEEVDEDEVQEIWY